MKLTPKINGMKIKTEEFGTYQNSVVSLYTLENENGMQVKIMDMGATITQIVLPDGASVACGFDTLDAYLSDEYKANAPYFGCTVGRYCSQIKDAKFSLNGKVFALNKNCGENNLHGGTIGFDKKMWRIEPFECSDVVGLACQLVSPDGDEGFPGEVIANVKFTLTNDNEIVLDYNAKTTETTPLSMTNHTYFNLSAFERDVEGFDVQLFSDKLMATDSSGAATGELLDVENTCNDLRDATKIGDVHAALGEGMEHFYVFDNPKGALMQTAKVVDKQSNRSLEVFSTEPCMLFYTAKFMSDLLKRNDREKYGKHRAFACETHRWQNGVNIAEAPHSFTSPEEVFSSKTIFKFKV